MRKIDIIKSPCMYVIVIVFLFLPVCLNNNSQVENDIISVSTI